MIGTYALALVAVVGGTIASYFYDDDAPFPVRIAYGAATGFAALAAIGFAAANLVGILNGAAIGGIAVAAPIVAVFASHRLRSRIRDDSRASGRALIAGLSHPGLGTTGPIVFGAALTLLLVGAFGRVIIEHDGVLATGFVNNLGDLPFHLQVTSSFAYGHNFPPEDPTFAGTGFAYPYLSDLLAAMFVALGASMSEAFFVENLVLGLALVAILYRFTRLLTADRLAGFIAPLLVLFSGGLGWVAMLGDARGNEQGVLATLGSLARDYTITSDGPFRWGNAITTLLVTQRSLLFGLPIALMVFILLWRLVLVDAADASGAGRLPEGLPNAQTRLARLAGLLGRYRIALAAGILTGSLPLVHAHSFVVAMGTAFFVGLFFREWRDGRWVKWAVYVVVALLLALPQIWWSTHDSLSNAGTFFGLEFGWDHRDENVIWFWFLNTGLFIPLLLAAVVVQARSRIAPRPLLLFSAAFAAWFIVPNVVKLAPWVWDNIKVLFYAFVGFVPLVAWLVARMLKSGSSWRVGGAAVLLVLTLAGGLDVWRVVSGQTEYQEFDADGVAFAGLIRDQTPPRALILHAPTYNPPVFLTGRRSLLGYTGYIWAHGLDYTEREADIKQIYAGGVAAEALLAKYRIDYIEVSPIERSYMPVADGFFDRFAKVAEVGEYRLYEVVRP